MTRSPPRAGTRVVMASGHGRSDAVTMINDATFHRMSAFPLLLVSFLVEAGASRSDKLLRTQCAATGRLGRGSIHRHKAFRTTPFRGSASPHRETRCFANVSGTVHDVGEGGVSPKSGMATTCGRR